MRMLKLALGLGAVLGGLWLVMRSQQSTLLEQAARVAAQKGWAEYRWESPQAVLTLRGSGGAWAIVRVDVRNGNETPLAGLNRRLAARSAVPRDWSLSPDGRWILWTESHGDGRGWPTHWCAAALDGSRLIVHPLSRADRGFPPSEPYQWMPDSRGWYALKPGVNKGPPRLEAYGLDPPGTLRDVPLSLPGIQGPGPPWHSPVLLGCAPGGRVLVGGSPIMYGDQPNDIRIYEVAPETGRAVRSFSIPVTRLGAHSILLSCAGDRLAWMAALERPNRVELRVSRLDGSDFQSVGRVITGPTPTRMTDPSPALPFGLRWTPDDKRISFLYKGELYTVPVPVPSGRGGRE